MEIEQTKPTILMFPWLAYSRVHPCLELAKTLSKRSFHIYFCSSAINLDSVRKNTKKGLSIDPSIDLVELRLPSSPELPPHFHTTKNLPPNLKPILLQAFQESSSSFSEILNALKPDLLIYDFFQPWAAKLALSQGIPAIFFATAGAAPFSYFHHLFTHGTSSTFPFEEICLLDHEIVDLRAPVKPKVKDADEDFAFGNFKLSCDVVLIRSLKGVEGKYIDYLSELCGKKVVPTGPLVQDCDDQTDDGNSGILQWLSEKDRFSTVFICFGSEHFLSMEQILEIAKGLELCETNFIWVVRFPAEAKAASVENALPAGFLEGVRERGLVVQGWAPQAKILSHPSIGGFVSHCGWSSIMESMYFGVPVIGMPIKFDQPINARLVVETGAGVKVDRSENGLFSGEEIAKAMNMVVLEKAGEVMRQRARNVSEKMKKEEEEAADEAANQLVPLCKK